MLSYDSGAAMTALPVAVARNLHLEKRGEFRVPSGAVVPNLGKIKMNLRGRFADTSRNAERCGVLLERNSPVASEVRAIF